MVWYLCATGVSPRLQCSAFFACPAEPRDGTSVSRRAGDASCPRPLAGLHPRHRRAPQVAALLTPATQREAIRQVSAILRDAGMGGRRLAKRTGTLARLPAQGRGECRSGRRRSPRPAADATGSRVPRAEIGTSRRAAGRKPRRTSRRPGAEPWAGGGTNQYSGACHPHRHVNKRH